MRLGICINAGRGAIAAALMATLALAACGAPPRATWTKEGVTEDQVKQDQKECVAEANSYGFLTSPTALGGGSNVATRQQGDIYRACMAKKGYGEAPSGTQPQPGQGQPAE